MVGVGWGCVVRVSGFCVSLARCAWWGLALVLWGVALSGPTGPYGGLCAPVWAPWGPPRAVRPLGPGSAPVRLCVVLCGPVGAVLLLRHFPPLYALVWGRGSVPVPFPAGVRLRACGGC